MSWGQGALELGGNLCCDLSRSWGGFLLMRGHDCPCKAGSGTALGPQESVCRGG